MKLILFDIDGTLVHVDPVLTRRVVANMLTEALEHVDETPHIELHGKTDRQIMYELCDAIGCDRERAGAKLAEMERALVDGWRRHLTSENVEVLPGVADLLERLAARDDVRLGLVTGNLEGSVAPKLSVHGLDRYFRLGAFGSDSIDRADLPPLAIERANRLNGHTFTPDTTLIVGDSHRDIACARASGIRSLAVATGALGVDELAAHEPTWVCESLLDDSYIFEFLELRSE